MPKSKSPGLQHVEHTWQNISHASKTTLNAAMYQSLTHAIQYGMDFKLTDMQYIAKNFRWGYWIGDGENLYSTACGCERGCKNMSAAKALEQYWGRPAWLWAEATKTPERLHVGSHFTWQGHYVKVTSFNDADKSLIACTYKDTSGNYAREGQVGSIDHAFGHYRRIEALKEYFDGTVVARFSDQIEYERAKIEKRFTITHDELMATRRDYDTRRKALEKEMTDAKTFAELEAVKTKVAALGDARRVYRHFDLEIIKETFTRCWKAVEEANTEETARRYQAEREARLSKDLERWVAGENVSEHFDTIRLRIKGDRVEVSNGNSVKLVEAVKTLAFVMKHRQRGWHENGTSFDVEAFKLKSVNQDSVVIGCTTFDWPEIERFQQLVAAHKS